MGLFGRDERAPEPQSEPAPLRPQAKPQPAESRSTTISRSSSIEGKLASSGDVTIEGEVRGTIEASGHLLVSESGSVDATLRGRRVTVGGKVKGDILADERIELEPSADVRGNITAPRILIKDGATFEGQVVMKSPAKGKEKAPGPVPPRGDAQSPPQDSAKDQAVNKNAKGG
jgi:cytoskeletal protein CcmA (bactofilin family)